MKHSFSHIALMMALLLAFSSCEKTLLPEDVESDGTEPGNLTVSIFQLEQMPFASLSRAAVTDYCTRLNFAVYDSDGTRVKQVNQKVDDNTFGTASFSLDPGDYQLVVVAHSSDGNPTMTNPAKIQFTNATHYTDTFLYNTTLTVGEEPQTLDVSLERIVSLCRFYINDAIPEGVTQLEFYYTGGSGAFNAATGLGSVNSKQKMTFDVQAGATGTHYDLYTFLHQPDDEISVTVTALDAGGNAVYNRDFDVPMARRKITNLSGDFFTGVTPGSGDLNITVTINATWDGEQNVTY